MERIEPKRVKIIRKPSLYDTLKGLPLGVPNKFHIRDFKTQAVRSSVTLLKRKGFDFTVSEAGMVEEYIVTRLK